MVSRAARVTATAGAVAGFGLLSVPLLTICAFVLIAIIVIGGGQHATSQAAAHTSCPHNVAESSFAAPAAAATNASPAGSPRPTSASQATTATSSTWALPASRGQVGTVGPDTTDPCSAAGAGGGTFDPGNIISDQVMYNTGSMTVGQIRAFIAAQDAACPDSNPWCSKNLTVSWADYAGDQYCKPVPPAAGVDTAAAIYAFSLACGVNPQVMLVTWQKESQGLDRADPTASNYDEAFGWNCPDSGVGGSANCSSGAAGFMTQLQGMAHQWARYRVEIPNHKYNYAVGTYTILWNLAETGCGGAPVNIANVATASLYVYTPYQPNAASLAAYPGAGDSCSSYGNRNFFFMFRHYFGSTGGGVAAAPTGAAVSMSGTTITLPTNPNIAESLWGKQIQTPNAQVAAGLAWAIGNALGVDYVYGGGGLGSKNPGGPDDGCNRAGGDENSCQGLTGYDCSGLSWTVYFHMSPSIQLAVGDSRAMSAGGVHIPAAQAVPGDLLTFYNEGTVGHVAVSLGYVNGQLIIMEAPDVGQKVRILPNFRPGDMVAWASRYWTGAAT